MTFEYELGFCPHPSRKEGFINFCNTVAEYIFFGSCSNEMMSSRMQDIFSPSVRPSICLSIPPYIRLSIPPSIRPCVSPSPLQFRIYGWGAMVQGLRIRGYRTEATDPTLKIRRIRIYRPGASDHWLPARGYGQGATAKGLRVKGYGLQSLSQKLMAHGLGLQPTCYD